jgi:hypothetical protein
VRQPRRRVFHKFKQAEEAEVAKDKQFERDVEAVWDAVRKDRRERRKLTGRSDLQHSAELLRAHADALGGLATRDLSSDAASEISSPADGEGGKKSKRKASGGKKRKQP